jgi:hypothetical protein
MALSAMRTPAYAGAASLVCNRSYAVWRTLQAGFAGKLTQEKLGAVPAEQRTSHVNREFETAWAKQKQKKHPSLAWALANAFFGPFLTASLCKGVYDCLQVRSHHHNAPSDACRP